MKRSASSGTSRGSTDHASATVDPNEAGKAGYERAKHLHAQVLGVVDTLNEKVSAVLAKQEKEFLRAYRAHMYTVQRELQTLRAKADEAALQLARDEKLKALEAERDWYRAEALRLDRFSTSLKGELTYLRDKIGALDDERDWLESELKTSHRKVKLLEATNAQLRGEAVLETTTVEDVSAAEQPQVNRPRPRLGASRVPPPARTSTVHSKGKGDDSESGVNEGLLSTRTSAELFAILVPPGTPSQAKVPVTRRV